MIENEQKGITLISLIVTIIILLILAVVSVNSIMGENGIIARAKESRILTILADILFNLDSNIIDINTDNILNDKKMVSTEMMDKLMSRGLLEEKEDYNEFWSFEDPIQYKIKGANIENFFVSYNGDVWLDNYKRGKVQLTTNVDTIYTPNAQTKITVIDGTIEELTPNKEYYLHAIKEREDFACWVNQYGEIVSYFANTIVDVAHRKEMEYTAIYNLNWRQYPKFLIGLDSDVIKDEEQINFDLNISYLNGLCCSYENDIEDEKYLTRNDGGSLMIITLLASPSYEHLINFYTDEDDYGDIAVLGEFYNAENVDCFPDKFNEEVFTYFDIKDNFYGESNILDECKVAIFNGYYVPLLDYEDLCFLSERLSINMSMSCNDVITAYQELGMNIDRIYFRCFVQVVGTMWALDENREFQLYYDLKDDGNYKYYGYQEPAIKYVDL